MKRLGWGFGLCLVVAWMTVSGARAEVTDGDLRQFLPGQASYDEVAAKLGTPAKTETNGEGFQAILYVGDNAELEADSIFVFVGAVDGVFLPGARSEVRTSHGSVAALVFDRNGILVYYRAARNGAKPVTSDDGAGPMPNVKLTLSDDQRQTTLPADDGKPHLGIQPVPVADLDEEHRKEFAAARFDGLVVANVIPGSVAATAGMLDGDYLYAINGMLVRSLADAGNAMATVKLGDTILARAKRIDEHTHLVKEAVFVLKF